MRLQVLGSELKALRNGVNIVAENLLRKHDAIAMHDGRENYDVYLLIMEITDMV
jgi:hypothetical protein